MDSTEILKTIESHPLTQQILAEKQAELLKKRTAAASRIGDLKGELESLPAISDVTANEERELKRLEQEAADLRAEITRKKAEMRSRRLDAETLISNLEGELFSTADSRIDLEIEFFRDLHQKLLNKQSLSRFAGKETNLIDMTETVTVATTQKAIARALGYCRKAVKTLESMKLEPELNIEKIEQLRADVPNIDEFTETTGSRPIPGSKLPSARDLLPSDDEMDWKIGKTLEKIKKVLRR
ncbi:MAG TPA: hypothetical protein PKV75_10800 [Desulfobacterales bacterium]|nr:hypothetical protein [Desulfobacterales bacterium]